MRIETTGNGGEISTVLMIEANNTSSTHNNSMIDNDEPNSPLTIDCDYFSSIDNRKDDEKYKRFVMVACNSNMTFGDEDNDYEDFTKKL
jgi:hypothetical protein